MSACTEFEFEIDSTGTLRLDRFQDPPRDPDDDLLAGRFGRHTATGRRDLYAHLSTLAAAFRADTSHALGGSHDASIAELTLTYEGRRQLQSGSADGYDDLWLLVSEIVRIARDTPMQRTAAPRPAH